MAAYGTGLAVTRSYDAHNRLSQLTFPDGRGNQIWTYTKDNLPASVTAYNDAGYTTPVVTAFNYNKRRLLTGESVSQPNWYTWAIGYTYDGYANLSTQTYPTGLIVDYAPNALGQPTKAGIFASGAQYYPNGALKQFTYANGIQHTMTQNARQLPVRVTDSGNALDYDYGYDSNGNIDRIYDDVTGTPTLRHRWMAYDGLDRLTSTASAVFGGSEHAHRFTYDALDNLTSWKVPGIKDYADYVYNSQNRLTNVRNTAGATVVGLSYDAQGNLANKNGQTYEFDYGNRLRGVIGKEYYRYDGLGRRVLAWEPSTNSILSQYSQSGQVVYQENHRTSIASENVYLAGSVVASRERNWVTNAVQTKYQHTDALGSPVAVTDEVGVVIERNDYEPYGAIIGKPTRGGIGYTGHVMDGVTGLAYMQQRYYDQSIGRFLSVDPVGVSPINGLNFNRYWYASNNPYKNSDPDGRCDGPSTCAIERDIAAMNRGDMSRSEFMERSEARAIGAAIGMTLIVIARSPGLVSAIGSMIARQQTRDIPKNPSDLLKRGYKEISHPKAAEKGHRTFENPSTGDRVRHDEGRPGAPGHEGRSHYHRDNPNATGRQDQYLDNSGNPTPRGSDASHLYPKDRK